jgi:DNA-directed RNA polymerase subunit RPC12/RpoP
MNRTYLTKCTTCGGTTSKSYARQHAGQCKECATGEETLYRCPDCGEKRLTAYQKLLW